jgi:hypothetical protein
VGKCWVFVWCEWYLELRSYLRRAVSKHVGIRTWHVNMWRVMANGDVESTGWTYRPDETVCVLMEKTASWRDWRQYKLAYGASRRLFCAPTRVQWADTVSIEQIETMSMRDWFAGVALEDGESRFLMISKLGDDGTERQNERRRDLCALYPLEADHANVAHDAGTRGQVQGQRGQVQTLLCHLKRIQNDV